MFSDISEAKVTFVLACSDTIIKLTSYSYSDTNYPYQCQ